jgi:integrase
MSSRFNEINEKDVDEFNETEENQNTKRKTELDVNLIHSYIANEAGGHVNRPPKMEELSPSQLDTYLSKFLLAVRKKNGEEYEPTTLRGFISSVERYLKKHRYCESVVTGQSFSRTRETLRSKQKQLKRDGKGNKPFEAASLTQEELEMLYSSGAFGCNSPQALINTLWYNNCLHFGLRGGKEQRDLKWGDVLLKKDTEGKEYLEYNTERQTKTRTGENAMNRRSVKPRMYENLSAGPERNPVFLYKLYKAKRPESYMDNNAPFYLGVNHSNASKADLPTLKWFKPQPMGVNKLNSLMKDCAQLAGIGKDKRITNHSARKTLVQKLQDNNIPPTQIVQITGHKNLQSVNNYSSLREQQQQDISSILSSVPNVSNARSSLSSQETISFNLKQDAINPSPSLFQGNSITGGTFNIHISSASSSASNTMIGASPKAKKLRRLLPLESDSSQDDSQEK